MSYLNGSTRKFFWYCFVSILFAQKISAQTDTTFWFAAPEVSQIQSSSSGDRPVYLRISTYGQSTDIKISLPANSSFTPVTATIKANTNYSINLSSYIDKIENKPGDKTLNYGIYIQASAPITVYYDVVTACDCNPEIYSLKGRNALGRDFFIPSQNTYNNAQRSAFQSIPPYSSFNIVATEDNTEIRIKPTNDIVGHKAGVEFSITLDKGETYAAIASSQLAGKHLGGSRVTSDKPIAITISDDLLEINPNADLAGDQIVPVSVLGKEYIVAKGFASSEYIYILATEDYTKVYINGSYETSINAGGTYTKALSGSAAYITTSEPVYLLHLSGDVNELSYALLPPVECTGSSQVSFTRSTSYPFGLILFTKSGNEGYFKLNGSTSVITSSNFKPVPGTNGNWVYANIPNISTSNVPAGSASIITNSQGLFHAGIINGQNDVGAEYGFFSNYSNLNLGPDILSCDKDSVTLDAGPDKSSYLWNTGAKTRSVTVNKSGRYYVTVAVGNCSLSDTVSVVLGASAIDIGKDTTLCNGDSLVLDAGITDGTYSWNTGSTAKVITVKKTGKYFVTVTTVCGTFSDTVNVTLGKGPKVSVGPDRYLCQGDSTVITPTVNDPGVKLTWQDGSGKPSFTAKKPGIYWVDVNNGCGVTRDSLTIYSIDKFKFSINDTTICGSQPIVKRVSLPGASFTWNTGSASDSTVISKTGKYWLRVSYSCGAVTDTFMVTFNNSSPVKLPADTFICKGGSFTLNVFRTGASYLWQDGSTQSDYAITTSGKYWVRLNDNGCVSSDSINVKDATLPLVNLGPDTTICERSDLQLSLNDIPEGTKIRWQDFTTGKTQTVTKAGSYSVIIQNECGTTGDTIQIGTTECSCDFYLPNVFSPNKDSINQIFKPLGCEVPIDAYMLEVFNRWGERLFVSTDRNIGWDGKFHGVASEEEEYLYLIRYKTRYDRSKVIYGTVTILR